MKTYIQWHDAKEELPQESEVCLIVYRWTILKHDEVTVRFAHYFCNRDTESGWYIDSDTESLDDYWPLGGEVLLWAYAPAIPTLPFDHNLDYHVGT